MVMEKRGDRGFKRIAFLAAAIAVLALLLFLPKAFVGHAVLSPEEIPRIAGVWNAPGTMTFTHPEQDCYQHTSPNPLPIYMVFTFVQSGDRIIATAPDFILPSKEESTPAKNVHLDAKFITQKILSANMTFLAVDDHPENVYTDSFDITLADDCNSAKGIASWHADNPHQPCSGTAEYSFTRQNPTGCGLKCIESFTCSDWSACVNGSQTKLCFDSKQCNKAQATKTESRPCLLPAPPKSNAYIYWIILLVLLIGGALAAYIMMGKGRKKNNASALMAQQLDDSLAGLGRSIDSGDKTAATEGYGAFAEMFEKYREKLDAEDSQRIYQQGMDAYNRLSMMR